MTTSKLCTFFLALFASSAIANPLAPWLLTSGQGEVEWANLGSFTPDGDPERIECPDSAEQTGTTAFSLGLWVKADPTTLTSSSGVVTKYSASNSAWFVQSGDSGQKDHMRVVICKDTTCAGDAASRKTYEFRGDTAYSASTWNLIGFTWDNGTLKGWINGAESSTSITKTHDASFTSMVDSTAEMHLAMFDGASGFDYTGGIDEFFIDNDHVITSGEWSTLYNSGTPIDVTTVITPSAYYRFESNSGTGAGEIINAIGSTDCSGNALEAGDINDSDAP